VLIGLALATLIGLSLGMLGGGGSILTVPVFVYVLRFGAKQAIAMSLPVVGFTSLIGALGHWRAGNVEPRAALLFGALAMSGAFAGARLATLLSGSQQLLLLGLVMLVAAASMFRRPRPVEETTTARRASPWVVGMAGMGVGILTGVVGIGGGFLIVPALVLLAGVPMKQAVGTSLLVIAMNSAAGFAGYLGQVSISWPFLAGFTAAAVAGIVAGTHLVRYVPADVLRRAFAVFLLVTGGLVFYQSRHVLTGHFAGGPDGPHAGIDHTKESAP
jgi:uncharacterized membrane protein YfcA